MNREEFIKKVDEKLKLVRNEYDYTQDKMAEIIGMSKKTLVQIEKGRASLGWSGAVVLCAVFRDSDVLEMAFGGQPLDLVLTLSFDRYEGKFSKTMGGRIWWKDVEGNGSLKIQQNIITSHYRILDSEDRRISSSSDYDDIRKRYNELVGND